MESTDRSYLKPNPHFDHAWAVVRLDFMSEGMLRPERVTVARVFLTHEKADEEVVRLNAVNQEKDCLYFVTVTRLERKQKRA